ncbi:RNA polymerase subunit sigma-24 [Mumia sp. zg.B17]|uniref:sigma factor n=1 Tax=unclassified Mumia TaxID=2621872 RepID=UPI001C6E9025|nr:MULTISPECIES: sigma factor [unclassified Mumia]MBW9205790.1 RNA polymerase subunit sigma-24 [Mumia sp. zg.B17]MDD9349126.1 sigma factor [Mumia sp.]
MSPHDLDAALQTFLCHRTHLFRVAYRIVRDVAGAEDVVQDAWLRWQRTDPAKVTNPAAFLSTTTTRLAINVIQSAHHRHERSGSPAVLGLADPAQDPSGHVERASEVEQVLHLLLERLTAAELAAYVLRKGFDYPYATIARLLETTAANARQLSRRGQEHLSSDRARRVDADAHGHLLQAFFAASRTGDLGSLERLLTEGTRVPSRLADVAA